MLPNRFKGFFSEGSNPKPGRRAPAPEEKETHLERQSRGLDQFFFNIRGMAGLSVLDLGGAVQENIEFVTSLGHRVTTQAFLQTLDQTFGRDAINEQSHPDGIGSFLNQNLAFGEGTFDGVLLWDTLQYMSPALLTATIDELYRITRPGSYMLGFFNSDDKTKVSPNTKFRIVDANVIHLMQKGTRRQAQAFNNRNLEKIFGKFESVKFFLTRESLREIIIRR